MSRRLAGGLWGAHGFRPSACAGDALRISTALTARSPQPLCPALRRMAFAAAGAALLATAA